MSLKSILLWFLEAIDKASNAEWIVEKTEKGWKWYQEHIGIKTEVAAAMSGPLAALLLAAKKAPEWAMYFGGFIAAFCVIGLSLVLQMSGAGLWRGRKYTDIEKEACRQLRDRLDILQSDDNDVIEVIAGKCSYLVRMRLTPMWRSLRIEPSVQEIDSHFGNLVERANRLIDQVRIDLPDKLLPLCDEIISFYVRKRTTFGYVLLLRKVLGNQATEDEAFIALRKENDQWNDEAGKIRRNISDISRVVMHS